MSNDNNNGIQLPNRKAEAVNKRFEVENNTLKRVVRDDANDEKKGDILEVELGDAKQPDFKPQAKIKRWKNEVNFSLRRKKNWKNPNVSTETIETGAKVKVQDEDEELHMYELDGFEDGGLEVETILKKKPKGKNANQIEFTLETKGLDFFYQPPLDEEIEPDEGETVTTTEHKDADGNTLKKRPENVVGSYAVYHNSKQNNEYKTGKAFHIYRPHITDADGNETWGELNIDEQNGLVTVTVPQEFLDNAVYPVKVDPTFGYSTIGGSDYYLNSNQVTATWWSPSGSGDVDKHTVHVGVNAAECPYGGNAGSASFDVAIYEKTGSTSGSYVSDPPDNAKSIDMRSDSGSSSVNKSWQDHSYNSSDKPSVSSSTDYWLYNAATDFGSDCFTGPSYLLSYDSGSSGKNANDVDSSALASSFSGYGSNNYLVSQYLTYTSSTSAPSVTTNAVDNITETSGDGNGEITDTGGADASERGFVYDTSSQSDPGNTSPANSSYSSVENETGTFGTGTFSLTIDSLSSSTTYYVRAYAENSEGYSYGSEVSFTTNSSTTTSSKTKSLQYLVETTPSALAKSLQYAIETKFYSREALASLPTNANDLATSYSESEEGDVSSDDAVRVGVTGSGDEYAIHQFKEFKSDTSLHLDVSWNGQSDVAPSTSTVYLQVYNHSTGSWETLDSNSSASAGSDFDLSGNTNGTASDYYQNSKATVRVYQREPV